jgi:tetratricopeptide (TPR) repeat protein
VALKLDPESAVGWFVKGAILDVQGKYGEAIQAYKNASILDKKYNLSNQYDINMRSLGNFHYDAREYEAALLYYYEAIMQDPANPEPRYDYANTLKMLHRSTEAEEVYDAAQKLGDTRMMGTREADTIREWGEDPWGE